LLGMVEMRIPLNKAVAWALYGFDRDIAPARLDHIPCWTMPKTKPASLAIIGAHLIAAHW